MRPLPPLLVTAGAVALLSLGCAQAPRPGLVFGSSRLFAGEHTPQPAAIAVDRAGNAYVVGGFSGTSWDPIRGEATPVADGRRSAFVLKLDPGGELLWSRTFGADVGRTFAKNVEVDAAGNAVVLAVTNAPAVRIEGATARGVAGGKDDVLLVAFAPDGDARWSLRLGGLEQEWPDALAVDGAGAVYLSARTQSASLDVGTGPIANTGPLGSTDALIVKVRAGGEPEWARVMGGAGEQAIYGLAVDPQGRLFAGGGAWDFTPPPSNPFLARGAPGGSVWLLALDPSGRELWSRRTPWRQGPDLVHGLVVGRGGDLYVTGNFGGTLDLGGEPLVAAGRSQIFLAALGPDGAPRWGRSYGTSSAVGEYVYGLALDACGDLVLEGDYGSPPVDFGGGPLATPALVRPTPFLVELGPEGRHRWSQGFTGGESNVPRALATSPNGDVWLAGFSQATSIDLGGGPIVRIGRGVGFVVRYTPAGGRGACPPASSGRVRLAR